MSDQSEQPEPIERQPDGDEDEFIGEEVAMREGAGGFEGEHGERGVGDDRGHPDDAGPM